jgi:inositol phosphorylceramide mannosyltransferase catalytic subunit
MIIIISRCVLTEIPFLLFQTFYNKSEIANRYKNTSVALQIQNPKFLYQFIDDARGRRLLKAHHDDLPPHTLDTFNRVLPFMGAIKGDLLRYALLYLFGGVYIDLDTKITVPFDTIIHKSDEYICFYSTNDRHPCAQNIMAATARHPALWEALNKSVVNLRDGRYTTHRLWGTLEATGPLLLNKILQQYYNNMAFRKVDGTKYITMRVGKEGELYGTRKNSRYYFPHNNNPIDGLPIRPDGKYSFLRLE